MTNQDKQFIELFKVILEENGYYYSIREQIVKEHTTIRKVAEALFWTYDEEYYKLPIYDYLDKIERYLRNHKEKDFFVNEEYKEIDFGNY